jgi:hypothetical protein
MAEEAHIDVLEYNSREVRKANIAGQPVVAEQIYSTFSISKALKVKRISTADLMYRLDNGRTRSQQAAYASHIGEDRKWFTEHTEDQSRQYQQHLFLWELAQRSAGSEGISILQALKSSRVQTRELLITADGIVVDGNRRLATMRELAESHGDMYSDYQYATCAVLPPEVNEMDIRFLEVAVQMAPETKLKYSWVNDGLTYRSFLDDGIKPEQIADRVGHGVSAPVVRRSVAALNEADIYLAEYARAPGDYDLVENAATAFKNLAQATNASGNDGRTAEIRAIAHVLISNANTLGERVYSYIQPLKDLSNLERIFQLIDKREELRFEPTQEACPGPKDDLFADLDDDDEDGYRSELVEFIGDPQNSDAVLDPVKNAAEDMLDERKQGALEEKPLKIIQKALKELRPFGADDVYPDFAKSIKAQAIVLKDKLTTLIEGAEGHLDADE